MAPSKKAASKKASKKPGSKAAKSRGAAPAKKQAGRGTSAPKARTKSTSQAAPKRKAAPKPASKAAPKAVKKAPKKAASKAGAKSVKKKSVKKASAKSAPKKTASGVKRPTSKPVRRTSDAARATGSAEASGSMELKATAIMEPGHDSDALDAQDGAEFAPPPRPVRGAGASGRISSRDLAIELARLASDDKCTDVVLLDVRGLSPISDFVIVASGTSDRQMRAVADHAEDLGAQHGHTAFRSSKDPRALWLLIDFSDVVIHIFEPNTRAHYDIEMMWGDAKRIDWERAGAPAAAKGRRGAGAGVN